MKNKIEMFLVKIFERIILLMSFKTRYKMAETLGLAIYYFGKRRRKIALSNLKIAFPDKNSTERKKIAKESYKNLTKNFFELFWIEKFADKRRIENPEILDEVFSRGKGVIIINLHLGNWEIGGEYLAMSGYPVYAVAKKQRNNLFNDMINKKREDNGLKVIQSGKNSAKGILKALKSKAMLVLVADQFSRDVEVVFFGKKTGAYAGPASLALKFDVPLIFTYQIRNENNEHIFHVGKEIKIIKTGNEAEDIKTNTQNYIDEMENLIRQYPEHWFWQHRRWRD